MVEIRRRSPRIKTNIAAAFRTGKEFLFGNIVNFSRKGFFIQTETLLPIDTELILHVRLPNAQETLTIDGRVVWAKQLSSVSPAGMGIEFIRESAQNKKKIALFFDAERRKLQSPAEPTRACL